MSCQHSQTCCDIQSDALDKWNPLRFNPVITGNEGRPTSCADDWKHFIIELSTALLKKAFKISIKWHMPTSYEFTDRANRSSREKRGEVECSRIKFMNRNLLVIILVRCYRSRCVTRRHKQLIHEKKVEDKMPSLYRRATNEISSDAVRSI